MPYLNDSIRQAQSAVEQKFLFRKIGLPFDYASSPDEFPSKAFATAREARANLPNPKGLGGGYEASCRNHALLFDSYLLRIEAGIESPSDEQILDRLIGGLIRLDTVAPKSFLIGGLSPDGRGFYALPLLNNHAAWCFAVMRGHSTAAISPESQEKFKSIVGKWADRLRRDKLVLHSVDGKPAQDGDLSKPDAAAGPYALAFSLAAAKTSGLEADWETYSQLAEENSRARFAAPAGLGDIPLEDLLWRQAVLSVIRDYDPAPERVELAAAQMRAAADVAAAHIRSWRDWDRSLVDQPVNLEWRKQPRVSLEQSPYGFEPDPSWARMKNEAKIADALAAMYTFLLAGDAERGETQAGEIEECLASIPWDAVVTLSAIAPAIGVHARGVELGLWDKTLYESRRESPASEISFAAKFLEPDYDEKNPSKAGHRGTAPGKKKAEPQGQGGDPRRRRRKRRR